ncbi:MAG: IS66 family transposase [Acidimicrobiia bacterium]
MSTDASLPDDLTSLQRELLNTRQELAHVESVLAETSVTCDEQRDRLEKLQGELEWLKRALFGRRRERHVPDPRQGQLYEETSQEEAAPIPVPTREEEITYRRRRGHGWSKLPAHLPREEVLLDVPESERTCACCGRAMQKIGEDRSERVDLVPARVWVKVLVRPKYACACKEGGVKQTPPPPSPTPGGRFDFGMTAHVVTSKVVDHQPLYRQQDILARSGLELSRSTLCEIMAGAAELLEPLAWLLRDRLLKSDLLGADDTPVRLLDASHPLGVRLARFWLFRGFEQAPYNVFYFHESRERDGPSEFLRSFSGVVKVDAYGVDKGVYLGTGGRIIASGCMAHARRKFDEAKSSHPRTASEALAFLQQLYDVEDRAKDLSSDERRLLRQSEASPILERWREWLDAQSASALPKLKLGEAIGYARNQWSTLIHYVGDGRAPIDNNDVERDLRALTIGRKNWMFIGSTDAGPRAAILYTVAASAARHDLDVWAYLRDGLERLASLDDDLASPDLLTPLLPDVWAQAHPESIRRHRQRERETRSTAQRLRRAKRRALEQARHRTHTPG